jgi:HK97 family phage major capsid protein
MSPVYNVDINHADLAGVIPIETAREIWETLPTPQGDHGSAVLAKCRRVNDMASTTKTKPVTDLLPVAYFRAARELVQATEQKWRNVLMTAEEVDVIVAIDINDLDDASIPVWDSVKPRIIEAGGAVVDAAMLYGTGIPASWATAIHASGIAGHATAAGNTTSLAAYDDLFAAVNDDGAYLAKLEADGFMATGHIANTSVKGKIRGSRDANGQPLFPNGEMDGIAVTYPLNGAIAADPLMVGGQWSELVWSVRKDIDWAIFREGIVQDGNGAIVYNLMQQRMVALMLTFRLGVALPNPVNRMQPTQANRSPFTVLTA